MRTRLLIYVVYLILLLSTLIFGSLYKPIEINLVEKVFAQEVETQVHFDYELNDKVPEFVIDAILSRYNLSNFKRHQVKMTLWCESRFYNVQSSVINSKGQREQSYGLGQIHLPSNPAMTKEQALDIELNIKWVIDNFETSTWYGYDRKKDACNN